MVGGGAEDGNRKGGKGEGGEGIEKFSVLYVIDYTDTPSYLVH